MDRCWFRDRGGHGLLYDCLNKFYRCIICLNHCQTNYSRTNNQKLEIRYQHKQETKEFINQYFEEKHIEIYDVNFNVSWWMIQKSIRISILLIYLKGLTYADVIEDLSVSNNVTKLRLINV